MNNFKPSDLIALSALLLTLITTCIGAILWYIQGEKKKYASERDFQHIRRNQENISSNITILWKDLENKLDDINRDILEIKLTLGIKNKDK